MQREQPRVTDFSRPSRINAFDETSQIDETVLFVFGCRDRVDLCQLAAAANQGTQETQEKRLLDIGAISISSPVTDVAVCLLSINALSSIMRLFFFFVDSFFL